MSGSSVFLARRTWWTLCALLSAGALLVAMWRGTLGEPTIGWLMAAASAVVLGVLGDRRGREGTAQTDEPDTATLRVSHRRLRLAADAADFGVHDYDILRDRIEWDARVRALWGVDPDEVVVYQTFLEGVHPDDRLSVETALRRVLGTPGEANYHIEYRVVHRRDQSVRWVVATGQVLRDVHGTAVRLVGTVQEITARRRAEEALRESETRLAAVLEQLPVGVALVDAHGQVVRANSAMRRFVPGPLVPSDGPGTVPQWMASDDAGEPVDAEAWPLTRALRGESVSPGVELCLRFPCGQPHWVQVSAAPLRDASGQIEGAIAVAADIDPLRRALAALRQSEALFRTIAESASDLLWMSDAAGRPIYQNAAWRRYVGLSNEELAERGWASLHPPEDFEAVQRVWTQAVATGTAFEIEMRLRRHDGASRWFLARTVPVRDENGTIVQWVGTSADIDALKRAQALLATDAQRKDEFLITLAHELRNPLAPMMSALELLAHADHAPALGVRAREILERQVRQMVRLVDDLLDIGRIARGKVTFHLEPVSLVEALEHAVQAVRPTLEQAGHVVRTCWPEARLVVEADPVRLAQVFSNLLTNAGKYTPPGGVITVCCRRHEGMAEVCVADTGIGLAADQLERIFDLFQQVDATDTGPHGGLGVGLALVRQLVERHGGQVEARSAGLGQGSEFIVRLP
ncbi:MAG: PAS domain S-box protein, partial [Gemmatimonadaceae bacterium]|nr:PAS domain S-box protein [Gemmatimonadaceae bacterium]